MSWNTFNELPEIAKQLVVLIGQLEADGHASLVAADSPWLQLGITSEQARYWLRKLEVNGVIERPDQGATRVRYVLTERGQELFEQHNSLR